MKLKNISKFKTTFTLIFYFFTILIGINFYLEKINYKKNTDSDFYKKLKEINYFKENKDPYLESNRLKLNPTNYFSIEKESKNLINSKSSVFTLNQYNFRKNPYNNFSDQGKKCILFTGSSAAFGVGVTKDNKTIPSQLHKIIGDEYLIYNLAIPSWNSRQELISIFNILGNLNQSNCRSIKTISFTGTADINNIYFSRKSKLFKSKEGRYKLINAPEQYNILEKKLEKLTTVESNIKYNLRIIASKLYQNLFGNLSAFLTNKKNDEIFEDKNFNASHKEFIYMQSKAFFYNQSLINNLINDLDGKHIVFIQPDLKNFNSSDNKWNYINNIYTNEISKNNCLNIVDLRTYLNNDQKKYKINGVSVPLSLKGAIKEKLFKKEHMNSHFYYDDSHFTDNGSLKVAKAISNYLSSKELLGGKCNLLKAKFNPQNK